MSNENVQSNDVSINKNNKEKKSIGKKIWSIIGWVVFVILVLFILIKVVDRFTDYTLSFMPVRSCVVSSGSMSKVDDSNKERLQGYNDQLQKGDLIYYSSYKNYDDIQINDVVVYYNGVTLVTHRVVEKVVKDNVDYVITQGDANNVFDGLIPYSWLRGKVVSKIPYIGYVTLYLVSPYGLLAISSVVLIVIVWAIVNELLKDKNKNEDHNIDHNEIIRVNLMNYKETNKSSKMIIISVSKNILLSKVNENIEKELNENKEVIKEKLS